MNGQEIKSWRAQYQRPLDSCYFFYLFCFLFIFPTERISSSVLQNPPIRVFFIYIKLFDRLISRLYNCEISGQVKINRSEFFCSRYAAEKSRSDFERAEEGDFFLRSSISLCSKSPQTRTYPNSPIDLRNIQSSFSHLRNLPNYVPAEQEKNNNLHCQRYRSKL